MKALCRSDLTERVVIEYDATTTDSQGGRNTVPTALATVWASVQPWATQVDEMLRVGGTTATARYRVRLRYRTDVTPAMRLRWTPYQATSAKVLEISAVSIVSRDEIRLDCLERAA